MTSKVQHVFELLGLQCNQMFRIPEDPDTFRINEELKVQYLSSRGWQESTVTLASILESDIEVVNMPTDEDLVVLRYAKLIGYRYVAKDASDDCYAYKTMPVRSVCDWIECTSSDKRALDLQFSLGFLTWDSEPFCLDNLEDLQ